MTTTTGQRSLQDPPSSEIYDPDEVLRTGSPLMKSVHPKYTPERSPSVDIPRPQVQAVAGDAVLITYLDNNRHADLPREISSQVLPSASDDGSDDLDPAYSGMSSPGTASPSSNAENPPEPLDLKSLATLATSALAFSSSQPDATPPSVGTAATDRGHSIESSGQDVKQDDGPATTRWSHGLPFREERPILAAPAPAASSPRDGFWLLQGTGTASTPCRSVDVHSPTTLSQGHGELPPLQMDSPRSDSNGHGPLPSIKAQLGDLTLNRLSEAGAVHETPTAVGRSPGFSRSPPVGLPRLSSMSSSQASPPISPNDVHRRDLPSPAHSLPAVSSYYYPSVNGTFYRPGGDYGAVGGDLPGSGPSGYASAASFPADHMNSFGGPNPAGGYVCTFTGCTAPPFQTQYLLNSHANVHSSARPHYCSVPGCPRSEGGKGFKRKNEMIRHGLVHDSPGYVCPFCPDREHKYPRPDNLQRHVRVHHLDKDKDDPALREVLSQRPDGPNRGRRRRGLPP